VNIKILVCHIVIGPAAAGSAGPVPAHVTHTGGAMASCGESGVRRGSARGPMLCNTYH